MATQLLLRRGTAADAASYTGGEGELFIDLDNNKVYVHDGSTVGGSLVSGEAGIDLTAFSVGPEGTASGNGSLTYNNITGVFTYTPADLSSYVLSSSLATIATTGSYNNLSDTPTLFSGSYNDLTNKPTLFSGSYNDLSDTPTLFSGSYNDLTNKPTIPTDLSDIIPDGTNGQVLTTDGQGNYTFTTLEGVSNTLNGLTDVEFTSLTDGQVLTYDTATSNWINADASATGVDLTAFSVGPENTASGSGAISYNNSTGVFTYTPPVLFSGSYNDLSDTPVLFSGSYNDLTNKPTLFSGSYNDLSDTPTLFSGSYNDLTNKPTLFSGSYNDLSDTPAIPANLDDVITLGNTTTTTAVIPFYYASQSNFPNASIYHGAIAHSHLDGAMYFAHGGGWNELANSNDVPTALTDLGISDGTIGQVLTTDGNGNFSFVSNSATSGISLTDLSVAPDALAAGYGGISYNDSTGVFTYTPPVLFSGSYNDLTNKPALFSGSYNDLTNQPTLFSGSYNDLSDTPVLTTDIANLTDVALNSLSAGQILRYSDAEMAWVNSDLVTINGNTLIGSGDITINSYTDVDVATYLSANGYDTASNIIASITDSAPSTLDTLNELAAALGDDPNFATTISTQLGLKANSADLSVVASSGSYNDLTNKPTLFSGSYNDLTNKPTLFSGSYNDLTNKPTSILSFGISDGTDGQVLTTDGNGNVAFESIPVVDLSNVDQNIIPAADSVYDVGSAANKWNNVYTDDLTVTGTISANGYGTLNTGIPSVISATSLELTAPAGININNEYSLPIIDGTTGQVLTTDGNGNTTFETISYNNLTDTPTLYTNSDVATYLSSNGYAPTTSIIASITDSAPTTLDTLNELAAALGDDPNFATTVTNSIATKANLSGATFTGPVTFNDTVTVSGQYTLQAVIESMQLDFGGGNSDIVFDVSNQSNLYIYNPVSTPRDVNVTNLTSDTDGKIQNISVTLRFDTGYTNYIPGLKINGVVQTVHWQGEFAPVAGDTGYGVITYSIIRASSTSAGNFILGSYTQYGTV